MSEAPDTPGATGDQRGNHGLVATVRAFPGLLFPFLPAPAALGCFVLAAAAVVASGIAWYGSLSHATGAALGVFVAVVLTAFTVTAAAVPRVVYDWLHHKLMWSLDTEAAVFSTIGAHIPLIAFTVTDLGLTSDDGRYAPLAAIGLVGAALWTLHEALRAKRIHDYH